jgi:hypothetical protein
VRAWGKIILRYKIVPGKDGRGFFVAAGSFKSGFDHSKGKDKYENYFMPDSSYEKEQIEDLVRDKVAEAIMAQPEPATTQQQAVYPHVHQATTQNPPNGQNFSKQFNNDEVPF